MKKIIEHTRANNSDVILEKTLSNYVKKKSIYNGFLAVQSSDGRIDWSSAQTSSSQTINRDDPFFIASITKMFTAAVVMNLRSQNKVELDSGISNYLPESLIAGIHTYKKVDHISEITVRHLLSHTSGLPDYFLQNQKDRKNLLDEIMAVGDHSWDVKEVTRIAREELTPKFKPGKQGKAFYSDTNYQLLGAIIESILDKSLEEAYNEIIFQRLPLESTYLFTSSSKDDQAPIYNGKKRLDIPQAMASFWSDGGIVSNTSDLLRFIRAFMDGELFPSEYLSEMMRWNKIFFPLEYGAGLMRFKLPWILSPFSPTPELIGHSGATGSFLFHSADADIYISGTLNQIKEQGTPFRIMTEIINRLHKI